MIMGFRENQMTMAEKLADVIKRNNGGRDLKIEVRPNETYITFLHHSWGSSNMHGIFHYCGVKIADWLKEWRMTLEDEEITRDSDEEYADETFAYYPKKYRQYENQRECPNYQATYGKKLLPKEDETDDDEWEEIKPCDECETCPKNIALRPVVRIQLFIKPDPKDCQHDFVYREDWGNDVCHKCGFMRASSKTQ